MRIFGGDPFVHTVAALENFDPAQQTATKADVLRQRVVAPRRPALGADSPADAVAISLDTYGEPRLDAIADLLGVDESEARVALKGLVYDDPTEQRLVPAAEYLSGNVRIKHAAAAAETDDKYTENVAALRAVIPADISPADITPQLGAAWIGPDDVQSFLREILSDRRPEVRRIVGSQWKITGGDYGINATSMWGTTRYSAEKLAEQLLRQAPIRVVDRVEDMDVFNPVETEAAQEKARLLNERFSSWVWKDPARADRLARVYNDKFNAIVLRSYDTDHMTLPGLVETFDPRPHQLAAVARMVADRRPVPRGRRREDRRDGHGRDGDAPARAGEQARDRRPEPHAAPVQPRVPPAVPAGPDHRGQRRRPGRRQAPRVRRPRHHRQLGRRHPDQDRVREPPGSPATRSALT
jgi:N12 class adenine-specific DNA methylase